MVLYETAVNATSEPFLCGLDDDCDELNCRLDILSTHYAIDVEVESCDSPPSVEVTVSDAGGRVLGRERAVDSRTFSVVIPEPNGTSVMVAVEERDSAVRLKVVCSLFSTRMLASVSQALFVHTSRDEKLDESLGMQLLGYHNSQSIALNKFLVLPPPRLCINL